MSCYRTLIICIIFGYRKFLSFFISRFIDEYLNRFRYLKNRRIFKRFTIIVSKVTFGFLTSNITMFSTPNFNIISRSNSKRKIWSYTRRIKFLFFMNTYIYQITNFLRNIRRIISFRLRMFIIRKFFSCIRNTSFMTFSFNFGITNTYRCSSKSTFIRIIFLRMLRSTMTIRCKRVSIRSRTISNYITYI